MLSKNIVIDNGSAVIKAGFSEEEAPIVEFPSIVGVLRSDKHMHGVDVKS